MAINTILNLVRCAASGVLGTAIKGCKTYLYRSTSIWLTPDGFVFDGSRDLDETYIQELKRSGNLIIINKIDSVLPSNTEDKIETRSSNRKGRTAKGMYGFIFKFVQGLYNNKALASLDGDGSFNILFVSPQGVLGTASSNGSLEGFTLGMHHATMIMQYTDDTSGEEGFEVQLTEREEMENYKFISNGQLTINAAAQIGIYQLQAEIVGQPTGTTIVFDIKNAADMKGESLGLTVNEVLITVEGSTVALTGAPTESTTIPGRFTGTLSSSVSTDDAVTLQVGDTANNSTVSTLDGVQYQSNVDTAVAA